MYQADWQMGHQKESCKRGTEETASSVVVKLVNVRLLSQDAEKSMDGKGTGVEL